MKPTNLIIKLGNIFELKYSSDEIIPLGESFDPNDTELIEKNSGKINISPPELLNDEWHVSHYSSNIDSVIKNGKFEKRIYGVSFARQPSERISAPSVHDVGGNAGVIFAIVSGKGLDYDRKDHKEFIESIYDYAIQNRLFPLQNVVFNYLRSLGIDWINAWNGIGRSRELHVLNVNAIKITNVLPISDPRKLRNLPRPNWFGEAKERLHKIKI